MASHAAMRPSGHAAIRPWPLLKKITVRGRMAVGLPPIHYTGSQEAAKWSLSGARPVLEVLGWSPVTHEGLYIIIQAVSTLLNGTLVVAWGPGVVSIAT